MLPVAILAGGLATRLRPMTETIPKSLIQVAGRPFIWHQLQYLSFQGVRSVVICTGFLGQMIKHSLGDGSEFEMQIVYSDDGEKALGTAGAIKRAIPALGDKFFVMYGDSYLPIQFPVIYDHFSKCGLPAMMTVIKNDNRWDKSNATLSDDGFVKYQKSPVNNEMQYIDYGLSVLTADLLCSIPSNIHFDLADLFTQLSNNRLLAGFEVYERFYEIGSLTGLAETETFLNSHRHKPED
jgi:MurNAc alpha-1-phosphate uridylyltransferase